MPALARKARVEHTLTGAVRAAQAAAPRAPGAPVFGTLVGGLSTLVEAAVTASGATVRRDAAVRELTPTDTGWRLTVGPTRDPSWSTSTPWCGRAGATGGPAAAGPAPAAAAGVGELDYASVALVTLALPQPQLPELSGFLVPSTEAAIKAATFFTTKWGHLRRPDGVALVRASVGRYGEEAHLQRPDADLAATVHRELRRCSAPRCPPRSTGTCSGGAARCRSTPPGTLTGSPPRAGAAGRAPHTGPGRRRLRRRRHPGLRPLRRDGGRRDHHSTGRIGEMTEQTNAARCGS